jgi:hypothetical protein
MIFFFFWVVLGLELRASRLLGRQALGHFCHGYFQDRVS